MSPAKAGTEAIMTVGAAGNQFITSKNKRVSSTVEKVCFRKEVYSPGVLTFQLNVTEINDESKTPAVKETLNFSHCAMMAEYLTGYGVKLRCSSGADGKPTFPCLNYYIYKVNPQFATKAGNPSIRLYITAYSVDHRLTLHKTNRAFTAKKFLSEVVMQDLGEKGVLKDFGVPVNHTTNPKCLQFLKSYKKTVTVKPDKKTTASYTPLTEIIQPYMVQYDESYYNFLARTANRCGEFMYFEDGQLNLGLDQPFYDKPIAIDYDDKTPAEGRKKSRNSTITGISLTRFDQPGQTALEPYYPKTMDNTSPGLTYAATSFVEDAKVGNDEFLNTMEKGQWVSVINDVYKPEGFGKAFTNLVGTGLTGATVVKGLAAWGVSEATNMALATVVVNGLNKKYDKNFWDQYGKDERIITKDAKSYMFTSNAEQWDQGLKDSVFKNVKGFTNELNLAFYHALLVYERKVAEEAITVETGADYDEAVKLGKVVKINGSQYVVTGVTGEYTNVAPRAVEKYAFTAIPVQEFKNLKVSLTCDEAPLQGGAAQEKTETLDSVIAVIPPLYENGHVCHSPMQRAIVANATDPQSFGRVQIRYPWQKADDAASPFIRVAKDCAGKGFGINFKTEAGTEVLVDYEGGNVERPYIVGMLHSFAEKPQYASRSIKSFNGHKIVFDDPVDNFKMFHNMAGTGISLISKTFAANRLLDENVKELSGGIEMSDAYGFYKIAMSTDKREINISSPMGKIDINAFTGITINAPSGDIKICGKNVEIEATNNLNLISGTKIDKDMTGSGGGAFGLAKTISSAVIAGVAGALLPDVKLIRCIVESLLKPCNGTLRIKSYRYLMLEAGTNGLAQIPSSAYKPDKKPVPKSYRDQIIAFKAYNELSADEQTKFAGFVNITAEHKDEAEVLIHAYNQVIEAKTTLKNVLEANLPGVKGNTTEARLEKKDNILNDFIHNVENINNYLVDDNTQDKQLILATYEEKINIKQNFEDFIKSDVDNPKFDGNITVWGVICKGNNDWERFEKKIEIKNLDYDTYFKDAARLYFCKKFVNFLNGPLNARPKIVKPKDAETADSFIQKLELRGEAIDGIDMLKIFGKFAADNIADGSSFGGWIRDCVYDSPFSSPWDSTSHAKGQILFSDSNTEAGRTIPLKKILDGDASFVGDPLSSINTLPRLRHKMFTIISNI